MRPAPCLRASGIVQAWREPWHTPGGRPGRRSPDRRSSSHVPSGRWKRSTRRPGDRKTALRQGFAAGWQGNPGEGHAPVHATGWLRFGLRAAPSSARPETEPPGEASRALQVSEPGPTPVNGPARSRSGSLLTRPTAPSTSHPADTRLSAAFVESPARIPCSGRSIRGLRRSIEVPATPVAAGFREAEEPRGCPQNRGPPESPEVPSLPRPVAPASTSPA